MAIEGPAEVVAATLATLDDGVTSDLVRYDDRSLSAMLLFVVMAGRVL